ncbi:uncharacterized protein LOC111696001 [Eurytemora carolleeae]|uniref:uncharacterized protein LOC111696001 n=1 Tax=Eurytemora carolleeae TaxID=1294199 RepID=UPI000C790B3C|nr:uncharacterized protein LOC111696001 [Eurytemora carolleeae]|eukprot:XP_023321277.1 uncharacterized protein LOC111696001 [Eurytemora affinis]
MVSSRSHFLLTVCLVTCLLYKLHKIREDKVHCGDTLENYLDSYNMVKEEYQGSIQNCEKKVSKLDKGIKDCKIFHHRCEELLENERNEQKRLHVALERSIEDYNGLLEEKKIMEVSIAEKNYQLDNLEEIANLLNDDNNKMSKEREIEAQERTLWLHEREDLKQQIDELTKKLAFSETAKSGIKSKNKRVLPHPAVNTLIFHKSLSDPYQSRYNSIRNSQFHEYHYQCQSGQDFMGTKYSLPLLMVDEA